MSSSTLLEAFFAVAWQDIEYSEVLNCHFFKRETIRAVFSYSDSPSETKRVFFYSKPNCSDDIFISCPREITSISHCFEKALFHFSYRTVNL